MTPDLLSRINAAIASRDSDSELTDLWWDLATRWLDESGEFSLATEAAMRGVLLALAREAWDCNAWRRLTIEPAGDGWRIALRNARHRPPSRARDSWDLDAVAHPRYVSEMHNGPFGRNEYATEDEALVVALESAPKAVQE